MTASLPRLASASFERASARASAPPPNLSRRGWVVPPSRRVVEQSALVRVRGRRRARPHAQLHEDVAHVALDRALADHELVGDPAVGVPGGDEPQHLELARGQPAGCGSRRARRSARRRATAPSSRTRAGPPRVRARRPPRRRARGRPGRSAHASAPPRTAPSSSHACQARRSAPSAPWAHRGRGRPRPAPARRRPEHAGLTARGDLRSSRSRRGPRDVAGGSMISHCRQQPHPGGRAVILAEDAPIAAAATRRALREPQQRQPGLRIAPALARRAICAPPPPRTRREGDAPRPARTQPGRTPKIGCRARQSAQRQRASWSAPDQAPAAASVPRGARDNGP